MEGAVKRVAGGGGEVEGVREGGGGGVEGEGRFDLFGG